jgi:hypothetical protein
MSGTGSGRSTLTIQEKTTLAKAYSATPRGVDALFVTVEVDRIRSQHPAAIVIGPQSHPSELQNPVMAI